MINKIETMPSKLIPMGTFNGKKEKPSIERLANSNNTYHKNNDKQKEEKQFSLNNANNYVYLGSTNMSLLNNMGVTLNDDGSLILIKGKTHDLFTGLYQKHFKGGFKYNVFNIETQNGDDMKFKELYVDPNGFLIGNKYSNIDNSSDLYKIKFNRVENEYSLNDVSSNTIGSNFIVEYEKYIVDDNQKQDLSSINDIVELKENNILKINREGLNLTIKLKDNAIYTQGLPSKMASVDQVDGSKSKVHEIGGNEIESNEMKEYKIKTPLKSTDKILAIKPILNQIQLVVDKGNKIKIYYLDPLNIFAVKDYQYEVTRLKQEPPLSFYSMVGENNYNNYHSGQPFSTQTIGNFSSRHIPFFSSFIDNSRLHISKAKEQYALKKYKAMMKNIAKAVDPGFRGLFCTIKQLTNSSTTPYNSKPMALYGIKENIGKSYDVLNRIVKGVKNGVTQGDVIYSLVKDLKEKENITINHHSDIRAFFGINAFQLPSNIGVNAFLLASYAKSHSITLSKSEDNKITFSFINNKKNLFVAGLSAGIGGYEKRWDLEDVDYGFVTPVMASALLSATYAKKSNFSFSLDTKDIQKFINEDLSQNGNENELIDKTTLEINQDMSVSLGVEIRSEASFDVDVMVNPNMELTIPRNAVGINFILNLLKLNLNISEFIGHGKIDITNETKKLDLNLLEFGVDIYRDLKFTPSTTNSDNVIQWYPLTSVKDFELMVRKRINSLLNFTIFKSEKLINAESQAQNKKNIKGIYKRVLKINKLLENFPEKYHLSNNIDKLDSIYLNLSSDKKPINKLKHYANKQIIESSINKFLSSLKERKETLSSQEKDNMNEKFKPYFVANYKLNKKSLLIRTKLKGEINDFLEKNKEAKEIDLDEIKKNLDDLYTKYKQLLENVEYQIASTDIMSVSELSYKKKTLPTGFVRLGNKKAIIHTQVKGNINYIYNEGEERMDKISTSYYF
ncbi:hypothetical protein [Proteus columbae]|uniref:hypothetical protein n=1 Tax=Proteus columbae TaxID=1987580 RepID=UPI00288BB57A|nr:hypothetical protein [Proteus columbae]